jgi:exopolysaccharide biosynthesis polyprenyl glycosylphosphotransferase
MPFCVIGKTASFDGSLEIELTTLRAGLVLKRAMDIVLSAAALLVTAPLFAVIALAIRLDSPGGVLYRGRRMGKKGRTFVCYKFRTMEPDADQKKALLRQRNEREGPFFKIADDPRVTRVGRLLRRYSLDELPQLWNVLRGEMSLVGPRPHPLDDVERYRAEHFRRLEVTPGMTGLWQVAARSDPSFRRSMALDFEYIDRWSLTLDLRILCRTIPVVLQGNGS